MYIKTCSSLYQDAKWFSWNIWAHLIFLLFHFFLTLRSDALHYSNFVYWLPQTLQCKSNICGHLKISGVMLQMFLTNQITKITIPQSHFWLVVLFISYVLYELIIHIALTGLWGLCKMYLVAPALAPALAKSSKLGVPNRSTMRFS